MTATLLVYCPLPVWKVKYSHGVQHYSVALLLIRVYVKAAGSVVIHMYSVCMCVCVLLHCVASEANVPADTSLVSMSHLAIYHSQWRYLRWGNILCEPCIHNRNHIVSSVSLGDCHFKWGKFMWIIDVIFWLLIYRQLQIVAHVAYSTMKVFMIT